MSENNRKQELSNKAKEILRRNDELRRKTSPYFSLQPGEKFIGLFDPEKIEPVEKEFEGKKVQKFQYAFKDSSTNQEKYWLVSKRTSELIDALLSEGNCLLKIQRLGSGNETRYNIFPV